MRRSWFWVRWSGRELRRRWVQVTVIALIEPTLTWVLLFTPVRATSGGRSVVTVEWMLAMREMLLWPSLSTATASRLTTLSVPGSVKAV